MVAHYYAQATLAAGERKDAEGAQADGSAQAIVLGSTELNLVVDVDANVLPIYDSARIHARRAAQWLLEEDA